MHALEMPVNIQLMDTASPRMQQLKPVTSLDTFIGGSKEGQFHPEGLFSYEIFGRPGSAARMSQFGRIDLKLSILHPFIYKKIGKLRGLYHDILHGRVYAKWNPAEADFEPSTILEGETGYHFFITHLKELKFKRTESGQRDAAIKLVDEAINNGTAFVHCVPVIPAGIRDVYIEPDGRISEDEINKKYRSLIQSSNAIPDRVDVEDAIFNNTRITMQNALNDIFEYLWTIYEGKDGFMYKKYYSRRVENGTRNVLTSQDTRVEILGQHHGPGLTSTVVGLFQTVKGLLPVATHFVLTGWVGQAFSAGEGRAYLVNPKTYKQEMVGVDRKVFDRWMTPDGINKVFNSYFKRENRHAPVMIGQHYLGLIYRGEFEGRKVFKIFNDIDDLPEGFDRKNVSALTLCELLYLSGYQKWNSYPLVFTRYPVAGLGSTVLTFPYVKTTVTGEERYELDHNWQIQEDCIALEFPIREVEKFHETASIHPSYLAGLGAD